MTRRATKDGPQQKISQLTECLNQRDVNLWELRDLALTRGGLVNAKIRRVAWRQLVGFNGDSSLPAAAATHDEVSGQELYLIRQDVHRSVLFHYSKPPATAGESSSQQQQQSDPNQERLVNVLETVILSDQETRYYQGLHDVAGVILLNLDQDNDASGVLQRICSNHLREATKQDLKGLTWFLQTVLEPILYEVDLELHAFLIESEVELSNAVLSWLLTWFTHDVHEEQVASRLVDAFVASHPLLPMYFAVAVLIHPFNRQEILECEYDATMVHMTIRGLLSKISPDWTSEGVICAQDLIDDAVTILQLIPPDSLMSLATRYGFEVDVDKATSISLLQTPPSWALASSSSNDDSELLNSIPNTYSSAMIACGVSEIMAGTDCIVSRRLGPSNALGTNDRSIHKLCGKIMCSNLRGRRSFLPRPVVRRYPNNCLLVALRGRGVHAVVFCWNRDKGIFVFGARQRRNKKVKMFCLCRFTSPWLGRVLGVITFTSALVQVTIRISIKLLAFSIAAAMTMCAKVVILFLGNMLKCLLNGIKPPVVKHYDHKQLATTKKRRKKRVESSVSTTSRSNYSRASHMAKVLYRVDHDTVQFKATKSHGQVSMVSTMPPHNSRTAARKEREDCDKEKSQSV